MPIIVVDDSRSPVALEGVQVVETPSDGCIGAGRNKGLEQAETDFILTRKTRLAGARALGAAAQDRRHVRPPGGTVGGLEVIDNLQTFFVGRRERLATSVGILSRNAWITQTSSRVRSECSRRSTTRI